MGGAASAEKKGSGLTASTGDLETVAPPDRSAHLPRAARPSHNESASAKHVSATGTRDFYPGHEHPKYTGDQEWCKHW